MIGGTSRATLPIGHVRACVLPRHIVLSCHTVSRRVDSSRVVSCRVALCPVVSSGARRLRFFHQTASHRLHERCCIRTMPNDNETQTALRTHCSARMTHISFASLVFRGLQRVLSADTRASVDVCVRAQIYSRVAECSRGRDVAIESPRNLGRSRVFRFLTIFEQDEIPLSIISSFQGLAKLAEFSRNICDVVN